MHDEILQLQWKTSGFHIVQANNKMALLNWKLFQQTIPKMSFDLKANWKWNFLEISFFGMEVRK